MPNRDRPREAGNPDTLVYFFIKKNIFGRPIAARPLNTPLASKPCSPRPKDCPGLGDPNTLKLRQKYITSVAFV